MKPMKFFQKSLFTVLIFLPALVYKGKGKLDYEGAEEPSGFVFEIVNKP